VTVWNPEGKLLGRIRLPETCANIAFGGPSERLFMCAGQSLYALYVNTQGASPVRRFRIEFTQQKLIHHGRASTLPSSPDASAGWMNPGRRRGIVSLQFIRAPTRGGWMAGQAGHR